jgi:hypothetical protein
MIAKPHPMAVPRHVCSMTFIFEAVEMWALPSSKIQGGR